MNEAHTPPGGEAEELRARLFLVAFLVTIAMVLVLGAWLSGQLSGVLTHGEWPDSTPGDALTVTVRWPFHAGDPAGAWPRESRGDVAGPVGVYVVLAAFLSGLLTGLFHVIRSLRRRTGHRPGFATPKAVGALLSEKALRKQAPIIRPSLRDRPEVAKEPTAAGFSLGRQEGTGRELWGHLEWSGLLLAAERMGKTMRHIVGRILDAPGPVITTSTRLDTLPVTYLARAKRGPVYVFDPQHLTENIERLRWSPVAGAEDPLVARQRADGFVAGSQVGSKNVENGAYFAGMASAVVRCYLHAAALDGLTMRSVYEWAMNPTESTPVNILRTHPLAAPMWADELASQASGDPRQIGNVWSVVRRSFDSFSDPRVLAACDAPADEAFDAGDFLARNGTLYLLGSSSALGSVAPLISALIEDIVRVGTERAQRSRGARLDPPLSLILDESTNIAPIPSLPSLMSDGAGKGLVVLAAMQSRHQARRLWDEHGAAAMWDTCSYRLVMGGLSDTTDLRVLSDLAGEFDEYTTSHSYSNGTSSYSQQLRRSKVLEVSDIRQLPVGHALLVTRNLAPVITELPGWWERPDADELKAAQDKVYALMGFES